MFSANVQLHEIHACLFFHALPSRESARARARVEWVTQCGQPITARKEPLPGDLERKKALGY
jgi:hypothetical protein